MLTVEEAQSLVLQRVPRMPAESVPLLEGHGRVLAEPVVADADIPPFDNTSMDGYAVVAADTITTPVELEVVGVVPAGRVAEFTVGRGQAAKIMTGAPMPEGADAVVQVEWTEPLEQGRRVRVQRGVTPGQNVRPRGEDMRRGQVVLQPGERLTPAAIGMLATLGKASVAVYRRPRVAIIATGDELLDLSEPLRPGAIRNSNSYALAAAVASQGGIPWVLPPARDELSSIEAVLQDAIAGADVVVSSGGVSVGDFDLVKTALERHGSLQFWQVRMKPGKPVVFGELAGRPFLGLPGNPVSALVTFELFVRPLLREMQGDRHWQRPILPLPLGAAFTEVSDRRHYVRVRLAPNAEGQLAAWPNPDQGSNIQTSWHGAGGLMIVPEEAGPFPAGSILPVMLLDS
jgi:molybdopterin molybdotransferase